jgi:hypothetical protein
MHNRDEVFQYFAVDFRSSDLAVHGSNALTKAVFVNDAIKTILALYKEVCLGVLACKCMYACVNLRVCQCNRWAGCGKMFHLSRVFCL